MTTKNLARTAIEGGRYHHYQVAVRRAARSERTALRVFLQDAERDVEASLARVSPRRKDVAKSFYDKLSAPMRYLDAQVGRPWNKVRSELFARFDARTTPGRHILFDHLLREVEDGARWRRPHWTIDRFGILRRPKDSWKRVARTRPVPFARDAVAAWLGNRQLLRRVDHFIWRVPMDERANVHAYFPPFEGRLLYVEHDDRGRPVAAPISPKNRYGVRLADVKWRAKGFVTEAQLAYLRALPPHALGVIAR